MNTNGIPTKWEICTCCNGDGQVGNPAFANGFTSEEWQDMSQDEDSFGETSADRYMRGDYDVPCRECGGSGKVRVPDMATATYAQKRELVEKRREDREEAMCAKISAAERRMGA